MDTPIKLLVDFVSSSQGDIANNTVQTGDGLGIVCLIFLLIMGVAGIFVFKKYKLMAMSKCGSSQSIFANNKSIVNKKSFKVIAALITMFVSLLIGFCFSQHAYGNNESHLVSDTNKITATVSDDGNISFSSCNLKNISDLKYTLSKCSVSVTQEAKSVDAINSSKLTISGFDGTIYDDVANGVPHEVLNVKALGQDESTKFGFSIANLSKESALALCGKPVFEINLQPAEENNMSINPDFVNNMTVDDVVKAAISTNSDGAISVESTDYLVGKITVDQEKNLEVAALKQSSTPQTITIKQSATDRYAADIVTFTVNKIDRKNLTISLDPESVDSLVIDQSQEISVNTDSTGKISVTNTDYLTGSVDDKTVSVRALKASQTEQQITISQEATDKYTTATATFTVKQIEKKDANLELDPSYVAEAVYGVSLHVAIHTDSSGKLEATTTDYLGPDIPKFDHSIMYVYTKDTSETECSISLNQEETDVYKSAVVTFTVGKIDKASNKFRLEDPSIESIELNNIIYKRISSTSEGAITADYNEFVDASFDVLSYNLVIMGKKVTNDEQTITVRQAESKHYKAASIVLTVKKVEKTTTTVKLDIASVKDSIEGRVDKVKVITNSSGVISTVDTEYLKGSVEKAGDKKTLDIKALKASESEQSIVIQIAESDTHKPASTTFKIETIYELKKYPLQEENNVNYVPVFNGKAIDNGYCFYYYDKNQSKYVAIDDSATMADLANYVGNIFVGIVDRDKTPSQGHKCIGIRCVNQSFNDATGLSTAGGGTATSYKGDLIKKGEHWCGLDWHPNSQSSTPTPYVKYESGDPSISEEIDTSVSIDDVCAAYGSKVFDASMLWSCVASNSTNAYEWDSSMTAHKWCNSSRTGSCGIVFSKTFGGLKRISFKADGYYYFPVFNDNEADTLGFKFYSSKYSSDPIESRCMENVQPYVDDLYVEIEPGKGHGKSGKCVAVRFVNETFNSATENSKWDPSVFIPRKVNHATTYGGNNKLPIEYWCAADWVPSEDGKIHPFPEISYKDGNSVIHTDVSVDEVWYQYYFSLLNIKLILSSVAYDEETCFIWVGPRHEWEFWGRNADEQVGTSFSRTFP